MNKKLLAVAVACALAAPGVALAQMTSVTISGVLKVGVDQLDIGSANPGRNGKNTNEFRVTDNSSRILLNMTEDLGSGMAAIGQVDIRFSTDIAQTVYATAPTNVGGATMSAGGNTWVGLRHKAAGSLVFGRADLHYGLFELNEISSKAGALMSVGASLFDFINGTAIAGATRTNNVVMYDSPNWGGFEFRAAWSANPTGVETDLVNSSANATTNTTRKGQAWNFNPKFTMGNWGVRYSHWDQKSDGGSTPSSLVTAACPVVNGTQVGTTFTTAAAGVTSASCLSAVTQPLDQVGDTILGWMSFGGLKVALGYNKSKLKSTDLSNTPNGANIGSETNRRDAWTIPVTYTFGPNNFYFHYTKANDDKDTAAKDGAQMVGLAYVYEFSKRTSVGFTFAKIKNDKNVDAAGVVTGGTYNLFTNGGANSNGQFGSPGSTSLAGEAPRLLAATIRHAF